MLCLALQLYTLNRKQQTPTVAHSELVALAPIWPPRGVSSQRWAVMRNDEGAPNPRRVPWRFLGVANRGPRIIECPVRIFNRGPQIVECPVLIYNRGSQIVEFPVLSYNRGSQIVEFPVLVCNRTSKLERVVSAYNRGSPNSTTWFGYVTVVIKNHRMPGFWPCNHSLDCVLRMCHPINAK